MSLNNLRSKEILNIVIEQSSLSREGTFKGIFSIQAETIFDKLNENQACSEIVFVQSLNNIKLKFPKIYCRIDIPRKWNGKSTHFYPEIYPDKTKIHCKVLKKIFVHQIYTKLNNDRFWVKDEYIWIPKNSKIVLELIEKGYLEKMVI